MKNELGIKMTKLGTSYEQNSGISESLPNELLELVIDELSTKSMLSLQTTCKHMRSLVSRRLWSRVELNFVTEKRSPMVREERWNKHFTNNPIRDNSCSNNNGKQAWIVVNRNNVEEFFRDYLEGYLVPVLGSVRNMNIVESLEGYCKDPGWGVNRERGVNEDKDDYRFVMQLLDPGDFPNLELIRVCSSISGDSEKDNPNGVIQTSALDLVSKFPRVEKYLWATRPSTPYPNSLRIGAIASSTTSLSLALDVDAERNLEEQLQDNDDPNNALLGMMSLAVPLLQNLASLQLVGKERGRCIIPAVKLRNFLQHAHQLRKLALVRIEVENPQQTEWLPSTVNRLQFVAREDRRHDEPVAYPTIECNNVHSLYVNLLRGKDTVNLRSLSFTRLTNLFYVSAKRDQQHLHGDDQLLFDVSLFENNPQLARVVYNCSSTEGIRTLGESCGNSLEILSLQRRRSLSGEFLQYDVDTLSELSKKCIKLRFLELRVSSSQMMNPVRVIKEFILNSPLLKEIYVVSTGKFVCQSFVPLRANSVFDGYCNHYVGYNSRVLVYKVDIGRFREYWCKTAAPSTVITRTEQCGY